jgi:hypothetical protein
MPYGRVSHSLGMLLSILALLEQVGVVQRASQCLPTKYRAVVFSMLNSTWHCSRELENCRA